MTSLSGLLKESWTVVEDRADKLAANFYARLFIAAPPLRDMFPLTMDVQRSRLLEAIVQAVQTVDDPERFNEYLQQLGRDHRKFEVSPEHYDIVGKCLIETLREYARDAWNPQFEQAWLDAYTAISQLMISGAADDADNPPFWHAEVIKHERRTSDIAVFTVRPTQPLPFRAGQYVSLQVSQHPRVWRAYSIANAPRPDDTLDFHVRVFRAGWLSSALTWHLKPGDMIKIGPPMGMMTLDLNTHHDFVGIAGGTGLAPIKALAEALTRTSRTRRFHLFVGARRREDLYDYPAIYELAAEHPGLQLIPAISEDPRFPGWQGPIAEVVAAHGPWDQHNFFVAGSGEMVRATLRRLAELGVPPTQVKYDAFSDTRNWDGWFND